MEKTLSVILVNTKLREIQFTIDCVGSLRKSTYTDFEIIIVQNGCAPETDKALRDGCPGTVLLSTEKNLGFGGANNVGMEYAVQHGARFVLLLNNDTIVKEDTIQKLVETSAEHPKAGLIGAKIFYYDRPTVIWYSGGRLDIGKALATHVGIGREDSGLQSGCMETDFVTGCCMLIKREVVDKIGLLDRDYFLYIEDADYSVRARKAGYSVLFQPSAILYHRVSSSTGLDSPTYIYFNLRNKLLFLRKNLKSGEWLHNIPYFIYFYGRHLIRLILRHRNFRAARAAYLGLKDGINDYTGEIGEGSFYRL